MARSEQKYWWSDSWSCVDLSASDVGLLGVSRHATSPTQCCQSVSLSTGHNDTPSSSSSSHRRNKQGRLLPFHVKRVKQHWSSSWLLISDVSLHLLPQWNWQSQYFPTVSVIYHRRSWRHPSFGWIHYYLHHHYYSNDSCPNDWPNPLPNEFLSRPNVLLKWDLTKARVLPKKDESITNDDLLWIHSCECNWWFLPIWPIVKYVRACIVI
jgi:hypothetical protein